MLGDRQNANVGDQNATTLVTTGRQKCQSEKVTMRAKVRRQKGHIERKSHYEGQVEEKTTTENQKVSLKLRVGDKRSNNGR